MIHIRPRVGMYGAFSRLNYKPWYALAEFVDNSIQSFVANQARLREVDGEDVHLLITIEVANDRVSVGDNAAGIAGTDFPRAFVPAEAPPDTTGLSEFGLGMKAAACWFGSRWWVRTKALGEPVERTIRFDIPKIVTHGLEDLETTERPAALADHYTSLVIEGLHHQPKARTIAKIKSFLGGMYRRFLASGRIGITYNEVDVSYEPPEVLTAPRYNEPTGAPVTWRRDFSLELDQDHRVHGWAALRERASTTEAGFAVFRRNRLVMGGGDEPYRPREVFGTPNKYAFQRLFGELSVEGFQVSHTKDGLQWEEWEADILDWLRRELDSEPLPLLRQAEGFRARAGRSTPTTGFGTDAVRGATQSLESHAAPTIRSQLNTAPTTSPAPSVLPAPEEVTASREVELEIEDSSHKWSVSLEVVREPSAEDWYSFSHRPGLHGEPTKLGIRLNLAHPFSEQFLIGHEEELDSVLRLASGLVIAEVTAEWAGVRGAPTIRRNLNQLLREALWRQGK